MVRVGDRVRSVPVVAHPEGGAAVRGDLLADALNGTLVDAGGGKWRLTLGDDNLALELLAPFVVHDSEALPMPSAPFRSGGQVFVPYSLATDVLPRAVNGFMYDAARVELRRFAPVTRGTAAAVASTAPESAPKTGAASPTRVTPSARAPMRQRIVVVDAGHGGRDPGTTLSPGGPRVSEKTVALAVALKLRKALSERGVTVVMTRTTDTLIALEDRGPIANKAQGDLFVSLHVNAANPGWKNASSARGFETYFLAEAKTEDERRVAAMENEAVKFETDQETSRSDPLGFVLRDMAQNEHLRESLTLATLTQQQLKGVHPGTNRGVKQAPFSVLVRSFMPSILVEMGFGSNRSEAQWLLSPAGQQEIADAIADACVAYLAQYERKVGGIDP